MSKTGDLYVQKGKTYCGIWSSSSTGSERTGTLTMGVCCGHAIKDEKCIVGHPHPGQPDTHQQGANHG